MFFVSRGYPSVKELEHIFLGTGDRSVTFTFVPPCGYPSGFFPLKVRTSTSWGSSPVVTPAKRQEEPSDDLATPDRLCPRLPLPLLNSARHC